MPHGIHLQRYKNLSEYFLVERENIHNEDEMEKNMITHKTDLHGE
jgi:hypothetical protein